MKKNAPAPEQTPTPFAGTPHKIMDSAVYPSISDAAVRLLLELTRHHDGHNNGALFASYRTLEKRGMGSHSKVERAFAELIQAGFIVKTKDASKHENTADCYMLTWLPATPYNRDGSKKDMPLLPIPMPIGRYLLAKPLVKEKRHRGAVRKIQSAKAARAVSGPDEQQDTPTPANPLPTGTMSTSRPTGQGKGQKGQNLSRPTGHPVPPGRTPCPAPASTPVPPHGTPITQTGKGTRR
jgi:hypothetical protein